MNNKNIIIGTLAVLLIISAYFNWQSYGAPSNQAQVKSDVAASENLFQKKQECEQYRSGIEAKLEGLSLYNPDTKYQSTNFLEKLFYSPKANTCLYVAKNWGLVNNKLTYETLTLEDALTGEMLTSSMREVGSENYLQQKMGFEDYLKDYE